MLLEKRNYLSNTYIESKDTIAQKLTYDKKKMIENRNDFSRTESVNILPVKTQWLNYYKANELCGV